MRRFIWLALPIVLAGCAGLPAIGTVAYLIDGASFIGTGKTVSDHALSAAAQQDCVLWRFTFGEPVCQADNPDDDGAPTAVAGRVPEKSPQAARVTRPGPQPQAADTALVAAVRAAKQERSWPVTVSGPEPIDARARTPRPVESAMRADAELLGFHAPAELIAEQPCIGGNCILPRLWGDG